MLQPMGLWLFKEEPTQFSFEQLQAAGPTAWTGVNNPLARKYLAQVQPGDRIWFYATGKVRAIVGLMRAIQGAARQADVVVEAVRPLRKPVTLARIKAEPSLADWELVRLPRLSVMPVTTEQWQKIEDLEQD